MFFCKAMIFREIMCLRKIKARMPNCRKRTVKILWQAEAGAVAFAVMPTILPP